MAVRILVIHGPNLNLLGEREPEIYGRLTLKAINQRLANKAKVMKATLKFFQANGEGEIIDFIHRERRRADGIVINPAAFTHYSYAIRDAIASVSLPAVEVHLSDIKKREPFRRKSVIAAVCVRQISGLGWESYLEGIRTLVALVQKAAT